MKHDEDGSGGTLTAGIEPTAPSTPSGAATFAPGETVAERYRIIRLLAGGGMGEVYEAEDLLLRERLALKTIRRDAAHDDRMLERFKREIQLARKVTHPNVCRIFDVGFHKDTAFLTMELLAGETLDRRLRRAGRLTEAEAEPIVAQLAAGLAAAHRAGVIHRDFKSANVMLVEEQGGLRAVITDFGLARPISPAADVTGNGGIVGSPSYMAPEQVDGSAVTHAADIYALGVVMYEMVTGKLPFSGDSPLSIAVSRLKMEPVPPRDHVPDLDPQWERAILRCMARHATARYATALDLVRTLLPGRVGESTDELLLRPRRTRRFWLWSAVGAAATALLWVAFVAHSPKLAPPPPPGRSVAVLGFKNLSEREDAAWISKALTEMLSTELAAGDKIRVVPGENVVRAKRELGLVDAEAYGTDTLERLRGRLGSDLVLTGSYSVRGRKLRFDLALQDTRTGDTVTNVAHTGVDTDLVEMVGKSGDRLRAALSVERPSPSEEARVRLAQPATADVQRLYAEGLAKLRNIECAPARDLLEQAVAAGPEYALARAALAEAFECLGYSAEGRAQARKAMELSAKLTPRIQMATEALYHKLGGDWQKALALYAALFAAEPDNIDYGGALAHLQMKAKKFDDLKETMAALRRSPLGDHMVVDLVEADIVRFVDKDLPAAVEVLQRVQDKARRRGVPTMVGQAQLTEAELLLMQKRYAEAEKAAAEGQRTFRAARDEDGVAAAAALIGWARLGQDRVAEARVSAEDGLRIVRKIGDWRRISGLVDLFVEISGASGALDDAARLLEQEENAARERNDRVGEARLMWRRALLGVERGDLARARTLLDKVKMVPLDPARPWLIVSTAMVRAIIAEAEGDGAAAHAELAEAHAALASNEAPVEAGLLRLVMARLALVEGRTEEAERLLHDASDDLADDGDGFGAVVLADGLLTAGRVDDAGRALESAQARLSPFTGAFGRTYFEIVSARLLATSRKAADVSEAREKLDDVAARAAAQGYVYANLEARLASGEVALRSGQVAAGRALLATLGKEAKARGFKTVAARAARLIAQAG